MWLIIIKLCPFFSVKIFTVQIICKCHLDNCNLDNCHLTVIHAVRFRIVGHLYSIGWCFQHMLFFTYFYGMFFDFAEKNHSFSFSLLCITFACSNTNPSSSFNPFVRCGQVLWSTKGYLSTFLVKLFQNCNA